jgi:hypothetical protein
VDNEVTIQCLGGQPFTATAEASLAGGDNAYHAVKNITSYVQQNGSCTYMVSGVASIDFKGSNDVVGHSVWWMAVLSARVGERLRARHHRLRPDAQAARALLQVLPGHAPDSCGG